MTTLQLPQTLHFASETYHSGDTHNPNCQHNHHHHHHRHHHHRRIFSASATLPVSVSPPKVNLKTTQETLSEGDTFHDYATVIMDVLECYMEPSPTLEEKLTMLEKEVSQEMNNYEMGEEKLIELGDDTASIDGKLEQPSDKQVTALRQTSNQYSFLNNFRRNSFFHPASSSMFDFQLNNKSYFAQPGSERHHQQQEESGINDYGSIRSYNSTILAQPKKMHRKHRKMNKRVKSFTQRVKNEDVSHRLTDLFQDDHDIWAKEKVENESSVDEAKTSCNCVHCNEKSKRRVVIKELENEYIYPTPTITSFRRIIGRRFHIFKHHVV